MRKLVWRARRGRLLWVNGIQGNWEAWVGLEPAPGCWDRPVSVRRLEWQGLSLGQTLPNRRKTSLAESIPGPSTGPEALLHPCCCGPVPTGTCFPAVSVVSHRGKNLYSVYIVAPQS